MLGNANGSAAATQGFQHFNTTQKSNNVGLGLNVTGMRAGATQSYAGNGMRPPDMAVVGNAQKGVAVPPRKNVRNPSQNFDGGSLMVSGNSSAIAQH